jgi:hypothetical protein
MRKSIMAASKRLFGAALAIVAALATPNRASAAEVSEIRTGRSDIAVFMLEGPIEGGETLALGALVSKLPPGKAVAIILHSPGGNLGEGLQLGRFFYRTRITTFVLGYGGSCASACALAFLGGRGQDGNPSRIKMVGGSLGFHQARRIRNPDTAKKYTKADMENEFFATRRLAYAIIEYLTDIGERMSFLHLMLQSPSAEMTYLSNEDALTYGIHVMNERNEQLTNAINIRARVGTR